VADFKIRIYKDGESDPTTTITIPSGILKVASKLIPKRALAVLQDNGIEIEELIKLSYNPEVEGTLVEIEEHKKDKKIIVSLD
jgi:hypothetical protein